MRYSIVVPVFNEEDSVIPLYEEVRAVLGEGDDWELIFVDDGSSDQSFPRMKELAATTRKCRVIRLRRNFGQTAAMAAGFAVAEGEIIMPMDGDLQNDPHDIPAMAAKIDEGFDIVSGFRENRQDKFFSRRLPSKIANSLISGLTGVHLRDYGCTFKAYRREMLEHINLYGELHRFVPALASQAGAAITEIPVNHRSRQTGNSKYGIDRTLRVVLDLLTVKFLLKYSTKPMQLFGKWGALACFLGGASGLMTIYMKLFDGLSMNRNPLLVLSAFLLFAGVQLFALGLLGELVTRTYYEIQGKPIFKIRETINLD